MAQAEKFYYYIDWGSGYVEIETHNNNLVRNIKRGEFNDYAFRTYCEGSFSLLDADATNAFTYFITNGNEEAPMRIYENGIMGSGTLIWEGWTRTKGEFDNKANTITLDTFRTDDIYTKLIPFLDIKIKGEGIFVPDVNISTFHVASQGLNANSNILQAYAYSAPNWAPTGNSLALPYIGRLTADNIGSSTAVYDNITRDLRRYFYSAPNWALSSLGTTFWIQNGGNGAIASYNNAELLFIDDFNNNLRAYRQTTGTWTLLASNNIESLKYPSLALMNSTSGRVALVDEGTKMLRAYSVSTNSIGNPFSVGDVLKPSICGLDVNNDLIALVDAESQSLRAMQYTTGTGEWSQTGDSINVGSVLEPEITYDSLNTVILHDSFGNKLQTYTFSGSAWSTTGNTLAVSGGLYSGIGKESPGILGLIQSDNHKLFCRPARGYITLVNGLLSSNGIYSGSDYVLNLATNGATFDVSKTVIGNLQTLREVYLHSNTSLDLHDYTLRDVLNLAETFQNYWYLEYDPVTLGDIQIKFKQPTTFTSGIPTLNVPASISDVLDINTYQEEINLKREDITFNNQLNTDFVGVPIEYSRNSRSQLIDVVKYTTDWGYLIDSWLGTEFNFQNSGLFMVSGEFKSVGIFSEFIIESGTGIYVSAVKNEKLSKSRIQDDYWKEYRYFVSGTITINGSSVVPQNTVNNLIHQADYQQKLNNALTAIGRLAWGGTNYWITEAPTNLNTYITTIKSRLLEI